MKSSLLILLALTCGLLAQAKAQTTAWEPFWKPDSTSQFEVGTQIRAWTIKDEGMTTILDEDMDCWRWRMFEDIQVNKGDEITLVGRADQEEQAKLDYIEFVRHLDQKR